MNFTPSSEAKNKLGEHTLFSRIIAYTIEPLPDNVSLSAVLEKVEELVNETSSPLPGNVQDNLRRYFRDECKKLSANSGKLFSR